MNPAASSKTRRRQTRSASRAATASSSEWVTPTKTHSPRPISPTTSPSTVTEARLTRWMSARTGVSCSCRPSYRGSQGRPPADRRPSTRLGSGLGAQRVPVPVGTFLPDLAAVQLDDVAAFEGEVLAGGGPALDVAGVGARPCPFDGQGVARLDLRDHFAHRVRDGGEVHLGEGADALGALAHQVGVDVAPDGVLVVLARHVPRPGTLPAAPVPRPVLQCHGCSSSRRIGREHSARAVPRPSRAAIAAEARRTTRPTQKEESLP